MRWPRRLPEERHCDASFVVGFIDTADATRVRGSCAAGRGRIVPARRGWISRREGASADSIQVRAVQRHALDSAVRARRCRCRRSIGRDFVPQVPHAPRFSDSDWRSRSGRSADLVPGVAEGLPSSSTSTSTIRSSRVSARSPTRPPGRCPGCTTVPVPRWRPLFVDGDVEDREAAPTRAPPSFHAEPFE